MQHFIFEGNVALIFALEGTVQVTAEAHYGVPPLHALLLRTDATPAARHELTVNTISDEATALYGVFRRTDRVRSEGA